MTPIKTWAGFGPFVTAHTGQVRPGQHATAAECTAYLTDDIDVALASVDRLITAPLPVTRKAGLADFVINGGSGSAG